MKFCRLLLFSFCVISVSFLLSSCNKDLSESQIQKDFIANEKVQQCFDSDYTHTSPFSLKSFTITKERIDEHKKEILLYCDSIIVNEYFEITLSSSCNYAFYDKGGWILEDLEIVDKHVLPIKAANSDCVLETLLSESKDTYYDNRIAVNCVYNGQPKTIKHGSLSVNNSELFSENLTTLVRMVYKSNVLEVTGYCQLNFSQDCGWYLHSFDGFESPTYFFIEDYSADYSSALGSFSTVSFPGYNILKYSLTIHKISDSTISYSLMQEGLQDFKYVDTDTLIDDFDPLTGIVNLRTGKYSMYGHTIDSPAGSFQYNPVDDRWDTSNGTYTYPSSTHSSQFFLPRQLGRS